MPDFCHHIKTKFSFIVFTKKPNSGMIKKVFTTFFVCLLWQMTFAQSVKTSWVDSVYRKLNANERIGQLFLVPVTSQTDERTINEIETLIKSHEIGGLIFKNINPHELAKLTAHFQREASVPLLIALEGDLATLLDSTMQYPAPLILGAIQQDSLLYELGATLARQLKMIGVNVLFTPDTRILPSGNTSSPSFNSFGQDKLQVTRKSVAIMRGLQDNGVIACAQYQPLNGITILDVRKEVPAIQMMADSLQRFPYATLMSKGLKAIAPSAAEFPLFYKDLSHAKKSQFNSAALGTLYSAEWLKRTMNFQGLIFVDIGKIDNILDEPKNGEIEALAFKKGNDVLMNPKDIGPAIRRIKKLLRKEDDYELQLEATVRKILAAKFDAELWQRSDVTSENLALRMNNGEVQALKTRLWAAAATVVRNEGEILPIRFLEDRKFAYISTHSSEENYLFFEYLKKYANHSFHTMEDNIDEAKLQNIVRGHDIVIVGVFPETAAETLKRLDQIVDRSQKKAQVILCDFGNPFFWQSSSKYPAVMTLYASSPEALKVAPQILFGALPASGKLPYSPSPRVRSGAGEELPGLQRLAYSNPEDARMNSRILAGIDSIAMEAIRIGATPGCQVFVARKGKVIYEKNFGSLTYENKLPVTGETIYDLASVTKVSATLQTAMFMYERGLLDLNKKVSYYLPELKKTNKKDITVMDMLTHQSGLVPFIPMYPQTMKDTVYLPHYYSRSKSDKYPLQVSTNLYASAVMKDSVWSWILKSKLNDKPLRTPYSYKYSDLGFLILQRMAERMLNQPMDEFLSQNFYEPLGAYTTGFNPLNRFQQQSIAPTEDDKIYRKTFVSGTVHDERAAMLGGVAGHAGLFSTANDLAKLGQMLLQGGTYGGIRYFKPETIELFTTRKYRTSRRGIGWDKPIPSDPGTLTSFYASPATFGHTGFTGTCIWVDPQFDLVYIFLSNRVYPDRNNKLSNANIRSRIQDVIYKSIFGYVEEEKPGYIGNDLAINASSSRP
jgi:beta-N-acetylhexosaminidase